MLGIYRGLCNSLGCCWFIKNIAWVYGGDGYSLDLVCTGSGGFTKKNVVRRQKQD